jgi:xanthine dehydrogenase molybdenum-binding subunit
MVITDKTAAAEYAVVGTRPIRHDGLDKVTGRAVYGADIKLTGLVYGAVVRSPHAHARIRRVDTSKAQALPGVLAVMTAADMPLAESEMVDLGEQDVNFKFASNRVMASDKVNYKGHPVAAAAAVDHNTALEAAKLVTVEYEVLKHVRNVREAMAPDAPVILEDLVGDHLGQKVRGTNVAKHVQIEFGDPESAFSSASTVIEHEYELATVHQGYIEPHTGTAYWNRENRLTVWTSTQGAFGVRRQLAGVLKMPESRIKVIPLEIGGGFGGKINVYLEPLAAILSRKCGRPVKFMMDRKTVFEASGPAAAGLVRIRMGVDDHARITAATADIRYEAGAYPGSPIGAAVKCVFAAYKIPNTRIDAFDVVVNKPKTAAYRAPGAPIA